DGEPRWIHDRAWLVRDDQGHPTRLEGIASDITARKEAESALRTSEEKYRSLVDSSDASIVMVDRDGRHLYLNDVAARPFGKAPEMLVGSSIHDLIPTSQADDILDDVRKVIDSNSGMTLEPSTVVGGVPIWFRT